MTTFATAATLLRGRFESDWVSGPGVPRTPIAWQNIPFTPGDDTPWVYFEVLHGDASQIGLGAAGARAFRQTGVVLIHVFTPVAEGTDIIFGLADAAAAILRGSDLSGVLCRAPRIQGTPDADGEWYRLTVAVPFQYDELS